MKTVSLRKAKAHLSHWVERAALGEAFIITKSGRPMVKVVPCEPPRAVRRLGFLKGYGTVDVPIKEVGAAEIAELFGIV